MRDYIVVSPERRTHPGGDMEPPEYGCDVAYVANARDATEAKWAAAKLWDKHAWPMSWSNEMRQSGKHPLTGVKVEHPDEPLDPGPWEPFYVDLQEVPA